MVWWGKSSNRLYTLGIAMLIDVNLIRVIAIQNSKYELLTEFDSRSTKILQNSFFLPLHPIVLFVIQLAHFKKPCQTKGQVGNIVYIFEFIQEIALLNC